MVQKYIDEIKSINSSVTERTGHINKYSFKTFGCQMNENDSEKMCGLLEEMGYEYTPDIKNADIVFLNTCCIRETAETKIYGHLGLLKSYKEEKPDMIVCFFGCLAQQEGTVPRIRKSHRHVDILFGTNNIPDFPKLLYKFLTEGKKTYSLKDEASKDMVINAKRENRVLSYLTVMYGCDNFCSYCIVPYVRGREVSRTPDDILEETKKLIESGSREIMLLGQNVNSYGKDLVKKQGIQIYFADLLHMLSKVENMGRIRFMTSHPKDLSESLIYAVRDINNVCKHIHLPVQSGSNRILEKMNRKYTRDYYLSLVSKIRANIPEAAITTDIIVGFPGETDEDFKDTLNLLKEVNFDAAYIFLYSRRSKTPAADLPGQVPEKTVKERFDIISDVQAQISLKINKQLEEKIMPVLVEGLSKTDQSKLTGKTGSGKIVNFCGSQELIGSIVDIKITEAKTWSLEGEIF